MGSKTTDNGGYDVIIIGGSYSGLSAGMALGRALRKVLIIDGGKPCNVQTPHSHNFLTRDGQSPAEIAALARQQVEAYSTIDFLSDIALKGSKTKTGFEINVWSGETFHAAQLIFATGIKDTLPEIAGMEACWGISVLHCPFCHGYEVRDTVTGVVGNGTPGYELTNLISNWTQSLFLFTNGPSTLTPEQSRTLQEHNIEIVEHRISKLGHSAGHLDHIIFSDESRMHISALYVRSPFQQVCAIPISLGCQLTGDGYIQVDSFQSTTVPGVFACGDNTTKTRTLTNAIATGTTAGMMSSKLLITQEFHSSREGQAPLGSVKF